MVRHLRESWSAGRGRVLGSRRGAGRICDGDGRFLVGCEFRERRLVRGRCVACLEKARGHARNRGGGQLIPGGVPAAVAETMADGRGVSSEDRRFGFVAPDGVGVADALAVDALLRQTEFGSSVHRFQGFNASVRLRPPSYRRYDVPNPVKSAGWPGGRHGFRIARCRALPPKARVGAWQRSGPAGSVDSIGGPRREPGLGRPDAANASGMRRAPGGLFRNRTDCGFWPRRSPFRLRHAR